ncbi:hypothetical protein NDU88_003221 [Pleurodeles waltl]|uniref:Uncharacterized protein n=1 Tax=Pleurodeles waltl TaxID=8319 RepID=A0AAV7SCU2_PLEWA|nr:hypothetical protein NDU88_003221 [Pleurodeles waltl]
MRIPLTLKQHSSSLQERYVKNSLRESCEALVSPGTLTFRLQGALLFAQSLSGPRREFPLGGMAATPCGQIRSGERGPHKDPRRRPARLSSPLSAHLVYSPGLLVMLSGVHRYLSVRAAGRL